MSDLYSISDFDREFKDDDACLEYLWNLRFGSDHACPKCAKKSFHRIRGRKAYACAKCGFQIAPTAGTIFHKSATKLRLWFFAIFLMTQSKNGVSATELKRWLGVTYKTTWRMGQQIRKLMEEDGDLFGGTVEVDETYVGGKGRHNRRGRGAENKTPVVGIVERGGRVKAIATTNVKASTVMPFIRQNVRPGTRLMTDEFNIYNSAGELYQHETVCHGTKEYVHGEAHTNTIEGFWGQLKRSLRGTYHAVSPHLLQRYVDEFSWRYNARGQNLFRLLLGKVGRHV
jgi:transposase-like protein